MSFPGLVLATPPYVPPPVDPDYGWDGLALTWTGSNGITWNLSAPDLGLILGRGIRGLGMPSISHYRDESPARAGSFWRGYTTQARDVFLPVRIWHDGSTVEFAERWTAFWEGFNPAVPGVLSARGPSGTRTLVCRYDKGGEEAMELDPLFFGWASLGIQLTAEQPFWEGTAITQSWTSTEPQDFFDAAGSPSFHISEGTSSSTAVVDNPGNESFYPLYVAYGPFTRIEIVYLGQRIVVPFAVPAGKSVVIDTRPETASVTDSDNFDRWSEMEAWGFAPITPGLGQEISMVITGGGSVSMVAVPRYRMAF